MRSEPKVLALAFAVGVLTCAVPTRASAQTQGTRLLTAARAQLEELRPDSAHRLMQTALLGSLTRQQTAYAYVLLGVTELMLGNSAQNWLTLAIREDSTVNIDSLLGLHSELASQFRQARQPFASRRMCGRVAVVEVSPASFRLASGARVQVEARARDDAPSPCVPLQLFWTSSDVHVARVGESGGLVTAVGPGTAVITARANHVAYAQAVVTVGAVTSSYVVGHVKTAPAVTRARPNEAWARRPSAAPAANDTILRPGEIGTIAAGQTRRGMIEDGDYTMADGTWADVWYVEGTVGQRLVITLRSRAFDSYLQLLDAAGGKVAEDDDSGGGGGAARITYTVRTPGRYQIVVNNFGDTPRPGAYTLEVR